MSPEQILAIAGLLADALIALVKSKDDRAKVINEAEQRQANAIADMAEIAKFGREP